MKATREQQGFVRAQVGEWRDAYANKLPYKAHRAEARVAGYISGVQSCGNTQAAGELALIWEEERTA